LESNWRTNVALYGFTGSYVVRIARLLGFSPEEACIYRVEGTEPDWWIGYIHISVDDELEMVPVATVEKPWDNPGFDMEPD